MKYVRAARAGHLAWVFDTAEFIEACGEDDEFPPFVILHYANPATRTFELYAWDGQQPMMKLDRFEDIFDDVSSDVIDHCVSLLPPRSRAACLRRSLNLQRNA